MTANKNLLRMKFARVIEMYAERNGCSLSEALDFFLSVQCLCGNARRGIGYALYER